MISPFASAGRARIILTALPGKSINAKETSGFCSATFPSSPFAVRTRSAGCAAKSGTLRPKLNDRAKFFPKSRNLKTFCASIRISFQLTLPRSMPRAVRSATCDRKTSKSIRTDSSNRSRFFRSRNGRAKSRPLAIVFALDVSGSMTADEIIRLA